MNLRFDEAGHVYTDAETGRVYPSITTMLGRAGLIDDTWYTEESSLRGQHVHQMAAEYDLGALDPVACTSAHKGYLQAYVRVMEILRPEWEHIEMPMVHRVLGYAGRPDRTGWIWKRYSVGELKSGSPLPAHQLQTALQAILVAQGTGIPAESIGRYVFYLRPNGKFVVEQHEDARDFGKARDVVRRFA